jgi:FRG domain
MAHTSTARSWSDLIELLYEGSWMESLQRHRSPFVFRGMSRVSFDLRSGLLRVAGSSQEARRLEPHLLRSFRKYAQAEAVAGTSIWRWLALAQHHGLPTRMLDWTWSPLVALHFVTQPIPYYEEDGVVVAIDTNRARAFLPEGLKKVIEKEETGVFSIEMLDAIAQSLRSFDELHNEEFVAFLDPPSLDARIVNQFAAFSVMNDAGARLDRWLEQHPELYRTIIVPAGLKWEVRDKLDQANVAERTLFPGLDGLCRWLTRYYTPRSRQVESATKGKRRSKPKPKRS